MARKNKQYTARRKPYEVYAAKYEKLSSRYDMKYNLMNESAFNKAYAMHRGTKNISKTLASKSLAVNKAQAIAISKAQSELTGTKVTWKNVMSNLDKISSEQWKNIQQTLQAWSN